MKRIFQKPIVWDKNKPIPQSINETIKEVDYIHGKISFKFFVRMNDYISDTITSLHKWPDCINLYKVWNKYSLWKYSYMIDVGANIGSCSVFMLHTHIKVISFEPIMNNLHLFTKSVLINKKYINNLTLYTVGLGNLTFEKIIYIEKGNWGRSSLYRKTNYSERIYIHKLDDIMLNITDRIGMMKIDIECSELNMIKGAIKFIKQNYIKIIYFEQLCICYENNEKEKDSIYIVLESLGYTILNKLNCDKEQSTDVVAIKR